MTELFALLGKFSPLELILLVLTGAATLYGVRGNRKAKQANRESNELLNWTINKLEKNRYELRKEYDETGWAPGSDSKPRGD